jgi:hypothetical protein
MQSVSCPRVHYLFFFSLCKHASHWLISPHHGPPRVTQPIIALVLSSISLERSSLGTPPCYSHKITQKKKNKKLGQESREQKCGKKKVKTIGSEVVKEEKKVGNCEITRARLVYTERSGTERSGTERRDASLYGQGRQTVC